MKRRILRSLAAGLLGSLSMTLLALPMASAKDVALQISDLKYGMSSGLVASMIAKEACTCRYIAQLSLKDCLKRSNLPGPIQIMLKIQEDSKEKSITVRSNFYDEDAFHSPTAKGILRKDNPRLGCHLVEVRQVPNPKPPFGE